MPEYLTPGVYVEEFEMGAKPIEGVSTSTAGFLGLTERGPTKVQKLVTSLAQYMRYYGGYIKDSYLTYAVEGFFANGGQSCFIGRIVKGTPPTAELSAEGGVTFQAIGEGAWGKNVGILIEDDASAETDDQKKTLFKLTVAYWSKPPDLTIPDADDEKKKKERELIASASCLEVFDNISSDPDSPEYYLNKFGDELKSLSKLICIKGAGGRPENTDKGESLFQMLTFEDDDEAGDLTPKDFLREEDDKPGNKRGLTAFKDIDEISILYAPDIHRLKKKEDRKKVRNSLLTQCELLKDRFAVLDVHSGQSTLSNIKITEVATPSKYGAIYYPWIKVYDPLTRKQKMIPPGGHVVGIYARSDTERGVHKAPANEVVRGALDLEFKLNKAEQGILNPRGINVIRSFQGRGILVWGARTSILDALWKYINVRRLFIYVEESIEEGTQWVVFEPNDRKLWDRVRATITQFLTGVWRSGALMGAAPEEAFFVKCDRSTMSRDDIDNGRLICVIGIAPVKPAEFVIFRIAQWAGGSAATE